jgi:hypothetical protein
MKSNLRTIQTAETDAFHMTDWAERFYPQDELVGEGVESPVVDEDGVVDLNAQILMGAVSILREDVLAEGKEIKNACLGIIEILGSLAQRIDTMETHLIRRLSTLELALDENRADFTNIFDIDPKMAEEVRAESEAADYLPVNPTEGRAPESRKQGVPLEILEAYNSWKHPDAEGTWQLFVKVAGGPVKAKEYRGLIES